uniref:Putative isac anti-complement n=1 Tax=Ixodes ricinus TaxID=34613 RepID=A0A0K8R8J2_IXORI
MKTALTCALLAISFLRSQCLPSVENLERDSGVETTTQNLYELHYRNNSALCGAQYRNLSHAEAVYNCTLRLLPPIVNQTWEEIRHRINKSIPEFVQLMCNFTVWMPEDFYLLYLGESKGNSDSEGNDQSRGTDEGNEKASSAGVTADQITNAEETCTAKITGWTTQAPTTLEPTETHEPQVIS